MAKFKPLSRLFGRLSKRFKKNQPASAEENGTSSNGRSNILRRIICRNKSAKLRESCNSALPERARSDGESDLSPSTIEFRINALEKEKVLIAEYCKIRLVEATQPLDSWEPNATSTTSTVEWLEPGPSVDDCMQSDEATAGSDDVIDDVDDSTSSLSIPIIPPVTSISIYQQEVESSTVTELSDYFSLSSEFSLTDDDDRRDSSITTWKSVWLWIIATTIIFVLLHVL